MKKFNWIVAAIALFAAICLTVGIWTFLVPIWMQNGAAADAELRDYIVAQMPELEGANASDISFDTDGIYHVNYKGQSFIVNDPAIQSNIAAFEKDYWKCDYIAGVKLAGVLMTIGAWVGAFFSILTGVLELIDFAKKRAKEKKEACKTANVTT